MALDGAILAYGSRRKRDADEFHDHDVMALFHEASAFRGRTHGARPISHTDLADRYATDFLSFAFS